MKFVKFNYILVILFSIFFAIIFFKFISLLSFPYSNISFEGESKREKLYSNAPLVQKITAKENNLSQISISINKFSPGFGDKIILEVLETSCEKLLAKSEINRFTWHSPGYKKFIFDAIPDSKDKTYCLKLTYVPKGIEQDKKAYISSYPFEGSSYINTGNKKSPEEQENRSLALKPAYGNASNWKNFSEFIGRMSQYKPDYFKGVILKILFVITFSLILAIGIFIVKI